MQESDILALLSEANESIDALKKFSDTEIPDSLSEAFEKGIDVAVQLAEGALLIAYSPDERANDRQRVIRLETAVSLLQQMEDEYLKLTVEGTLRALWGYFTFWEQILKDAALGIWAAIEALDFELAKRTVLFLWRRIINDFLSIIAVAEIQKPLREVIKLRGKYDKLARAKALPQRSGKRVWRRKRTRT